MYVSTNSGKFAAVNLKTGRTAWKYLAHRCVAASPAIGPQHHGSVFAVFLNRPPCNAQTGGHGDRRRRDRLRRRLREDPLDEDHRPLRDLAAAARQPALRRRLERRRVGDRRAQRQDDLALPHRRRGQGRRGVRRREAVRRLVRRAPLLPVARRQADLEGRRRAAALRPLAVLLDAGGRVRPRLHRLDRREGLLVRRDHRQAPLVAQHRRLRLRVARGRARPRLRGIVLEAVLRLRRGHRRREVELPRATARSPARPRWSGISSTSPR